MANAIMVIRPYWYEGTWVFDDESTGLVREAFVSGADEVISDLVERIGIPDAKNGFLMFFSAKPFPGYQLEAEWAREEMEGNWYRAGDKEGWLCPALFKYFEEAPEKLYVQVKERG